MLVEVSAEVPRVWMRCNFMRNDKVVIVAPKDNRISAAVERFPAAAFAFVASAVTPARRRCGADHH
jgi:hypothetical protein